MRSYLEKHGLIDARSVQPYWHRTRDREVPVFIDTSTGLKFVDNDADNLHYYRTRAIIDDGITSNTPSLDRTIEGTTLSDAQRRAEQYKNLLKGKVICDFGAGHGGFVQNILPFAGKIYAVEVNRYFLDMLNPLKDQGVKVFQDMSEVDAEVDVVTSFHVLEHLTDPVEKLQQMKEKLRPDGTIIVEVPHARDFLMEKMDLDEFKSFVLQSAHLVLHTRETLKRLLLVAGFKDITVHGFQRYGIANHLFWLRNRKPGGHEKWADLDSPAVNDAYSALLKEIDQTDTLIVVGRK